VCVCSVYRQRRETFPIVNTERISPTLHTVLVEFHLPGPADFPYQGHNVMIPALAAHNVKLAKVVEIPLCIEKKRRVACRGASAPDLAVGTCVQTNKSQSVSRTNVASIEATSALRTTRKAFAIMDREFPTGGEARSSALCPAIPVTTIGLSVSF